MKSFVSEFRTLSYIIEKSPSFLLCAHTRPDVDTLGATLALSWFLKQKGKSVSIVCFDPFPPHLTDILPGTFLHPDQVDIASFGTVIACDSVDRGFDRLLPKIHSRQVTVTIDHHPDIAVTSDLEIIDTEASSTCEILFAYFEKTGTFIGKEMATALLAGIIFDTGNLQHACTTPHVMDIASTLMKKGAPLRKIVDTVFINKKVSALRLWGRAFEQSILNEKTGMLATAITQEDIAECQASPEDAYQVASVLSTVPEAKFALVLLERDEKTVRASLRSMERHNVDVSAIAHRFGGGGHRLASGFEIPGKITRTIEGWTVI